jgi:hypothetical protein
MQHKSYLRKISFPTVQRQIFRRQAPEDGDSANRRDIGGRWIGVPAELATSLVAP